MTWRAMFMDLIYHIEDLAYRVYQLTEAIKEAAAARARVKELKGALRELMAWGVEYDNPNIGYITVQVDRPTIVTARRILHGEEER